MHFENLTEKEFRSFSNNGPIRHYGQNSVARQRRKAVPNSTGTQRSTANKVLAQSSDGTL